MASLIQDLGILETVLGDMATFASGRPVSNTQTIAGKTFTVTAEILPSGPVAPFQTFSGGFLAIFSLLFEDYTAISAGQPVSIAEKIGNTWYGTTLTLAAPTA